jgi:hypothetical protein
MASRARSVGPERLSIMLHIACPSTAAILDCAGGAAPRWLLGSLDQSVCKTTGRQDCRKLGHANALASRV